MKYAKPTILLCWGYHRKGWLNAFNQLSEDFNFHYIFHIEKPENERNFSKSDNILYWSDFSSSQELLKKIKPKKIVMMGTDGINTTALNVVAKKRGIETIVLQHGMFHTYVDYLHLARKEVEQRARTGKFEASATKIDRLFLLRFFLRSVSTVAPKAVFYMLQLQYYKRKLLDIEALKTIQSKFRIPSKYVVFTKENASIYLERDGASESDMVEIGNPEMDSYFKYESSKEKKEHYFLLLDTPLSEIQDYNSAGFGISKEQTNDFYGKLAEYAKSRSAVLKIKLHPYSYNSNFQLKHPNIEYIKDANVVDLIMEAEGVFGFNSTLTLPAIYFKKCCLFSVWKDSSFQNTIEKLKLAQVLDYNDFITGDINLENIKKTDKGIEIFVRKFFFNTDGRAVERLKAILKKGVE